MVRLQLLRYQQLAGWRGRRSLRLWRVFLRERRERGGRRAEVGSVSARPVIGSRGARRGDDESDDDCQPRGGGSGQPPLPNGMVSQSFQDWLIMSVGSGLPRPEPNPGRRARSFFSGSPALPSKPSSTGPRMCLGWRTSRAEPCSWRPWTCRRTLVMTEKKIYLPPSPRWPSTWNEGRTRLWEAFGVDGRRHWERWRNTRYFSLTSTWDFSSSKLLDWEMLRSRACCCSLVDRACLRMSVNGQENMRWSSWPRTLASTRRRRVSTAAKPSTGAYYVEDEQHVDEINFVEDALNKLQPEDADEYDGEDQVPEDEILDEHEVAEVLNTGWFIERKRSCRVPRSRKPRSWHVDADGNCSSSQGGSN